MAYNRYVWNVVVTFLFAALLWTVAIVATHGSSAANIAFWLGLIVGMVAIQADHRDATIAADQFSSCCKTTAKLQRFYYRPYRQLRMLRNNSKVTARKD